MLGTSSDKVLEYSLSIYVRNILVPHDSLYPYSSSIVNEEVKAQMFTEASRDAVEIKAELEEDEDE